MTRWIAALLLATACTVSVDVSGTSEPTAGEGATVVRVIDGDTVVLRIGGAEERVRFIGMDTPERSDPLGPKATAFLRDLLPVGTAVTYRTDAGQRDRYGRLLAYVWRASDPQAPEAMLNARLLSAGWARTLTIPPNVTYADLFASLQRTARTAKRGMWATDPFDQPGKS
jgi:micrococcal nuclease